MGCSQVCEMGCSQVCGDVRRCVGVFTGVWGVHRCVRSGVHRCGMGCSQVCVLGYSQVWDGVFTCIELLVFYMLSMYILKQYVLSLN